MGSAMPSAVTWLTELFKKDVHSGRRAGNLVGLLSKLGPHQLHGGQAKVGEPQLDASGIDGVGPSRLQKILVASIECDGQHEMSDSSTPAQNSRHLVTAVTAGGSPCR